MSYQFFSKEETSLLEETVAKYGRAKIPVEDFSVLCALMKKHSPSSIAWKISKIRSEHDLNVVKRRKIEITPSMPVKEEGMKEPELESAIAKVRRLARALKQTTEMLCKALDELSETHEHDMLLLRKSTELRQFIAEKFTNGKH